MTEFVEKEQAQLIERVRDVEESEEGFENGGRK